MKAGKELDALIAEKVMGWKPEYPGGWPHPPKDAPYRKRCLDKEGCTVILPFSTDIAAAWEVVEKIKANHALTIHAESLSGGWLIHIDRDIKIGGATAPHAICLAALKAAGE